MTCAAPLPPPRRRRGAVPHPGRSRRPRAHRALAATVLAVALGGLLAACSSPPARPGSGNPVVPSGGADRSSPAVTPRSTAPASGSAAPGSPSPGKTISPSGSEPGGGIAWLVTRAALADLVTDSSVRSRLAGARIYEILQPGQQRLPGITAEPVVTFSSAATLEAAVRQGQLPDSTYGVLYDPEAWSYTPAAEQRDPVAAAAAAARTAHAHGLKFLVAPALNLTTVLDPGGSGPRWQRFLSLRLAARMAAIADVVELQAQSLERVTASYRSFVRTAAGQARAARAGVTVLAGLSTNPPGAPVSSQHLADAIEATRDLIDGYWLNIPGQGAKCPTCQAPQPEVARQALQRVF